MRKYTMRDVISEVDAAVDSGLPEPTEAMAKQIALSDALESAINRLIDVFCEQHPEIDTREVAIAMLCSSATLLMARLNMPPSDFGELAKRVADLTQDEASQLRRAVMSRGQG